MPSAVRLKDYVPALGKTHHIPSQSGVAFFLPEGYLLRVIDPEGEQVSDLMAYPADDLDEWLSSGRSIDYNGTIAFTEGSSLYSNRSRKLLYVKRDTVGRHDFLFAPCSPEMFQALYGFGPDHPSCFRNLADNLAAFGIPSDRIPTTFNIFMNVELSGTGEATVRPPISVASSFIEFVAETDLVVGLTACSAEQSNNWRFKPIDYEIEGPA